MTQNGENKKNRNQNEDPHPNLQNSLLIIPKRSQSSVVKDNQIIEKRVLLKWDIDSLYISVAHEYYLLLTGNQRPLSKMKMRDKILGPVVALNSVGLYGAEG